MPLKPGDLVIVVKPVPCCGNTGTVGKILTVLDHKPADIVRCVYCNYCGPGTDHVMVSDDTAKGANRLRRIPPLVELESKQQTEKTPC